MAVHTETSMFAREVLETRRALCNQIYGIVGITGRFGNYECATTWLNSFFLGSHKEDVVHFCKREKRQQSEGEVAFKVNAGGQMEDCKINWLNTTGVPILLPVQCFSQMGAITDISTSAAFLRNLTAQSFVQLERETNGHLYLSLVDNMSSQPNSDTSQLQGFQAAAHVLDNLYKLEKKNFCLAASSHNNITVDS